MTYYISENNMELLDNLISDFILSDESERLDRIEENRVRWRGVVKDPTGDKHYTSEVYEDMEDAIEEANVIASEFEYLYNSFEQNIIYAEQVDASEDPSFDPSEDEADEIEDQTEQLKSDPVDFLLDQIRIDFRNWLRKT